jgi:hypothetical protein
VARTSARPKCSGGRELADWVAELAIESGLTLAQAREHSIAQLRLLSEAAGRLKARDAMIDSQVVFAAMAAVMHKDNHRILKRLQDTLIRQASGE